jgi:drug/metabolite transporter (DMT)-like permease
MGSTTSDTIASETVTPGHANSSRPGVWLTDVSLVAMALLWGVNFSVVKYGTSVVDPLAYNAARLGLAAIVLLGIVALSRAPLPSRATIITLLGLGVLGNGIYQYFFVEGITRTSATDAALVVAASPVFTAIIGKIRGVERLATKGVIGILLSVVGIGCVVLGTTASNAGESSLLGDLLVLGGSLAWSIYSVLLKPHTERVTGMQLSAFTMLGGAVPLAIVAWPEISGAHWSGLSLTGWASIVYSGIFSLVIAYYFFYRGVRVIGPTRTTMYSNLQPIIAVFVAWVMLSETPTVWQCIGMIGIMTGLLLTRSRQ